MNCNIVLRGDFVMMTKNDCVKMKLSASALGIAFGLTEAIFMMLFAWTGSLFGYGISIIHQIAEVYLGYDPSFIGGLLGGIWGFIDGFVFGIVAGSIYNVCCHCFGRSHSH